MQKPSLDSSNSLLKLGDLAMEVAICCTSLTALYALVIALRGDADKLAGGINLTAHLVLSMVLVYVSTRFLNWMWQPPRKLTATEELDDP